MKKLGEYDSLNEKIKCPGQNWPIASCTLGVSHFGTMQKLRNSTEQDRKQNRRSRTCDKTS